MSDEIDDGLRGVLGAARRLAAQVAPEAIAAEPERRCFEGVARGVPVVLELRRSAGAAFSALAVATIAEREGPLCAVTVVGMPHAGSCAPILGVDLVALGGALSLIAVDLAPTDEARWTIGAGPALEQLHLATEGSVVHRRWPEFALEVFSPRALLAGARRGREGEALRAVAGFVEGLAPLYAETDPRTPEAEDRAARWRAAERRNRREHDALTRIFGEAASASLIDLLFPP